LAEHCDTNIRNIQAVISELNRNDLPPLILSTCKEKTFVEKSFPGVLRGMHKAVWGILWGLA
jgi:hypothetical protein